MTHCRTTHCSTKYCSLAHCSTTYCIITHCSATYCSTTYFSITHCSTTHCISHYSTWYPSTKEHSTEQHSTRKQTNATKIHTYLRYWLLWQYTIYNSLRKVEQIALLGTVQKLRNPLWGREEVTKRLHKITRGKGDTLKDCISLKGDRG